MRFLPVLFFLLLGALLFFGLGREVGSPRSDMLGQEAPELNVTLLSDVNVKAPALAELRGRPVLLNFFASWCVPCLAEHHYISELAKDNRLMLYGIAWKDVPEKTMAWLAEHGNPYSITATDSEGISGVAYGITGVPESFLIDAAGKVVWHSGGALTPAVIREEILPKLEEWKDVE